VQHLVPQDLNQEVLFLYVQFSRTLPEREELDDADHGHHSAVWCDDTSAIGAHD
jgi:hypothetical protein